MNTDDPHLKCHLMSQIILHICPHHHVVVLKLRCRRSCHNANENLRNYGKGNLRNLFAALLGKGFPIGNAYSYTVKKDYSCLCMWMTSNWLERNKTLIRCGKYSTKKLIWENQHLSLIMYIWDVLKNKVDISKDIVDNYRTVFESRFSAGATEKLPCSENLCISLWSCDMEGHAKKLLANRTTHQLYKVSTPCIDDPSFQRRRIEIRGRIGQKYALKLF